MNKDIHILQEFIPESTVKPIVEWLHQNEVQLKISRSRRTKFGDFKAPKNGEFSRISVNHNLNRYAFLITLVHEMAHVKVWKKKNIFRRTSPHGQVWQDTFSSMMQPFIDDNVFPQDLLPSVVHYFKKPKASSVSDQNMMRALKIYDKSNGKPQLNELSLGDKFLFRNTSFEVMKKLRTRFQCRNIQNRRIYLIHGIAEVEQLPK